MCGSLFFFTFCFVLNNLFTAAAAGNHSLRTINVQAQFLRWPNPSAIPYCIDSSYSEWKLIQIKFHVFLTDFMVVETQLRMSRSWLTTPWRKSLRTWAAASASLWSTRPAPPSKSILRPHRKTGQYASGHDSLDVERAGCLMNTHWNTVWSNRQS